MCCNHQVSYSILRLKIRDDDLSERDTGPMYAKYAMQRWRIFSCLIVVISVTVVQSERFPSHTQAFKIIKTIIMFILKQPLPAISFACMLENKIMSLVCLFQMLIRRLSILSI